MGKILKNVVWKYSMFDEIKDERRNLKIIGKELRVREKSHNNICRDKWYKYRCNICGWDNGWIVEYSLDSKSGCSCCAGKTVVEGINDIPTTAPWMVKYFQGGYDEAKLYTRTSNKKIYPICPECGNIRNINIPICTIYKKQSIGCSCGDGISYPNKFAYNMLKQLGLNFISEYSPEWINPKRYDFYFELNNNKYILEMDGGWHNKDNNLSGQSKEKSKNIDKYKYYSAIKNGIKVIRINCGKSDMKYIAYNILHSELTKILNLSVVDWIECDKYAISNLAKEICLFWSDNSQLSSKDLSKIYKLNYCTIIKYLKIGSIHAWCQYLPSDERLKGTKKVKELMGKPIEVFKNNVSYGKFNSTVELANRSYDLFQIKFSQASISRASNSNKEYKGFIFKY